MLEFQKGDASSFETLMRKYYARIFNFIYRFVGSREVAEDLTQEVFIKVHQAAPTYQPRAKFQTWVYTIAKNISLNELRRKKFSGVSIDDSVPTQEGQVKRQVEDVDAPNPSKEIEKKEAAQVVQEAVQSLPENQRMAVVLRRYEKLSYEDIAKTMDMSVSAVKSLLSRARESLRQSLAGYMRQ